MPDHVVLLSRPPSVDDYRRLRVATGLSDKLEDAARIGLAQTWFGVTLVDGNVTVGMGRIIGDGGTVLMVVDVAVDPAYQGQGLGKRIMSALMDRIQTEAPSSAFVCLMADGDAKFLYERYGFRATAPRTIAMAWQHD